MKAYYHKSSLFISSVLSYLTLEGSSRVDLFTLSGGYEYFGRKWEQVQVFNIRHLSISG